MARLGGQRGVPTASDLEEIEERARIEELRQRATAETRDVDHGVCRVVENVKENRLQLLFPEKPDDTTRRLLKRFGFRWSPRQGARQRQLNGMSRASALALIGALKANPSLPSVSRNAVGEGDEPPF